MISKPYSWEEVDVDFIPHKEDMPRFEAHVIGIGYDPGMRLKTEVPEVFIVTRLGKEYVCKREGYSYIRRMQRIK